MSDSEASETEYERKHRELLAAGWTQSYCGIYARADGNWSGRTIWEPYWEEFLVREVRGRRLKHPRMEQRFNGYISTLPDRQSCVGEQAAREALCAALNGRRGGDGEKPVPGLMLRLQELLLKNYVEGSSREWFAVQDSRYTLVATPNGSYGYVYVAAYPTTEGDPNLGRCTAA